MTNRYSVIGEVQCRSS